MQANQKKPSFKLTQTNSTPNIHTHTHTHMQTAVCWKSFVKSIPFIPHVFAYLKMSLAIRNAARGYYAKGGSAIGMCQKTIWTCQDYGQTRCDPELFSGIETLPGQIKLYRNVHAGACETMSHETTLVRVAVFYWRVAEFSVCMCVCVWVLVHSQTRFARSTNSCFGTVPFLSPTHINTHIQIYTLTNRKHFYATHGWKENAASCRSGNRPQNKSVYTRMYIYS